MVLAGTAASGAFCGGECRCGGLASAEEKRSSDALRLPLHAEKNSEEQLRCSCSGASSRSSSLHRPSSPSTLPSPSSHSSEPRYAAVVLNSGTSLLRGCGTCQQGAPMDG